MRVLNKQKLEKEIRSLFHQLRSDGLESLTEEKFNQALAEVFAEQELSLKGGDNHLVSILIADLRGFTYIVEKVSAAKIIQILNEYFGAMVEIIDRHGGIVDKFMGDSVIAFFESNGDIEESVLNVLKCAIEMQVAMDEVNRKGMELGLDSLYMGIGINTGEVVASVLGSEIYREYTVIGANVNLASRIEGFTMRGQILLSEQTRQYVVDSVETGPVSEVNAKGMQGPLRFFALKAIKTPTRLELPVRENRRALRIPVRVPVVYQLLDGKNILPEIYQGEVVDISYGGMLIISGTSISRYSDIKMSVNLTPFHSNPVDLYAKAMYVQTSGNGVEVGLEFTIIDDATSATLRKFVDNLI